MKMLKIAALPNGAHSNQGYHGVLPEGWAIIPADMETPNFPFGEVEVAEVDGVMTVTKWAAGVMPDPVEEDDAPSVLDKLEAQVTYTAMMTDTLLEG